MATPHNNSGTTDLWVEAIKELDEHDKALIWGHAVRKLNVLDDVLASAKSKENESKLKRWTYTKRDGTKAELHTLFNRVVDKVSRFKKLGDSIAALDKHLAIPWVAVGLSLQIAGRYFEHSKLAHEGVQMMMVLVPRYTVFESLYLQQDSQIKRTLESEMVRLYARALRFIVKLKTYYEMGTASMWAKKRDMFDSNPGGMLTDIGRIIDGVWLTSDQLEELMNEVQAQQVIVDDIGRLVDAENARDEAKKAQSGFADIQSGQDALRKALQGFQDPIQDLKDGMVDLVKNLRAQEEMEILKWLSPISYDRHHQSLRMDRLEGSGLWIFDQPQYKKWRTAADSSILCLQGIPGTGKSILMSLIIDSLRANQLASQAAPLAYLYCSRNRANHENDGPEALTRNIIKQLARPGPKKPIRGAVVRKYQDLQQQGYGSEVIAFPDTRNVLLQLVDQGTTMLFIDAVDECTPSQQKELFQLVETLLKPDGKRVIKILISSRPSLDISTRMAAFRNTYTIDAGRNHNDIQMFANLKAAECVKSMKLRNVSVSNTLQERLTEALISGAQGMFLWIKLQADLLNDPKQTTFEEDVLRRVRDAPTKLSGLYSTIYEKLTEGGPKIRETAVTMFHWLLCAAAPLGRSELRAVLSKHLCAEHLTEAIILDSCSNLVMVDEGLDTFRFIHTSVKDFFETKAEFSISKRNATVAEVCLREVVQGVTIPPNLEFRQESLHCYVILYWVSHVEKAGPESPTTTIENALRDLCLASGDIRPWFKQWLEQLRSVCDILEWNDPFKDKVLQVLSAPETSFFAACAFGFTGVVTRYRETKPAIFRAENEMGATGLHLACQYGHIAVAKELLSGKADIDAKDKYGETPLTRACSSGHTDMVELLLYKRAKAKVQGRRFGTALQAAALHGHLNIVRLLVKHGVDIEAEGGQFGTALQAASHRGHLQVVKELLVLGADVNAPGGDYDTIYETAPNRSIADGIRQAVKYIIDKEHEHSNRFVSPEFRIESSMQLMLDRTLDINLKKSSFGPAIHAASRAGHGDIVKELITTTRVDLNSEGGRYGSSLQAAVVSGRFGVVTMLLDAGADVNSQNGTYGTPLTAACRLSHYDIANLLIAKGAAVDAQAGVYGTPLQAAARSGNRNLVLLLLKNGANANLVAGTYGTPMQAAARDGFDQIITLLLDSGADPGVEGGSFGTALQAASGAGHLKSVKLLLDRGSEVGNALQVACLGGYTDVLTYLLEHGGDINSRSPGFGTAIQAAVAGQHLDLVRLLLDKKEKADESKDDLATALYLAASMGDESLTRMLLERGASPTVCVSPDFAAVSQRLRCAEGNPESHDHPNSALQCAAVQGHENTVQVILEKLKDAAGYIAELARGEALESAARFGHINIVRLLITERVDKLCADSALCNAVQGNYEVIVRLMLKHDTHVSWSAINIACMQGNRKLLELLLEQRQKLGIKRPAASHLLAASLNGHVDIVRILLDNGANPNALAENPNERLKSFVAAYDESNHSDDSDGSGDLETSDEVGPGPVVYFDTAYNVTALYGAVIHGHEQIVNILLEHHARLTVKRKRMASILQVAASIASVNIVNTLLNHGADVGEISGCYGTALQAAALAGSEEVVRVLLGHGADVNQEAGEFGTALQAAAAHGHESVVRQLLEARADVQREGGCPKVSQQSTKPWSLPRLVDVTALGYNAPGRHQNGKFGTSLQAAAESGSPEIVRLLLDRGADIRDTDQYGQTPLHRAACHGHEAVVALLLEEGANPNDEDTEGQNPIIMAVSNGWKTIYTLLAGAGATPESTHRQFNPALHRAAANGHVTILEQLLNWKYDVDLKNSMGDTALIIAARKGWSSATRLLLAKGADINHRNNWRNTALSEAVIHAHDAVVGLLLSRGASPNEQNVDDNSPLHLAVPDAFSGRVNPGSDKFKVFYLLAHHPRIKLELRDSKGATALHRAAGIRNRDMVAVLINKGADIEARDSRGQTPLHYCVFYVAEGLPSPLSVLQFMVQHGADIHAKTNEGQNTLMVIRDGIWYLGAHESEEYLASIGLVVLVKEEQVNNDGSAEVYDIEDYSKGDFSHDEGFNEVPSDSESNADYEECAEYASDWEKDSESKEGVQASHEQSNMV